MNLGFRSLISLTFNHFSYRIDPSNHDSPTNNRTETSRSGTIPTGNRILHRRLHARNYPRLPGGGITDGNLFPGDDYGRNSMPDQDDDAFREGNRFQRYPR